MDSLALNVALMKSYTQFLQLFTCMDLNFQQSFPDDSESNINDVILEKPLKLLGLSQTSLQSLPDNIL